MKRLAQESNVTILQQAAVLLERENAKLTAMVLELRREIAVLNGQSPEQLLLELVELETPFPAETEQILGLIRELYAIEKSCPRGPDGDEERTKRRATESRAVLTRIQQWCVDVRCLPQSGLERAIKYMAKRWSRLTRFLDDPRLPLDNNGPRGR